MTKYGLIGQTLGHSFSRGYFTKKFEQLGLENYQYDNYEFANIQDLADVLRDEPDLRGFNVTIPYKEQILPFLSETSAAAAKIGAVNVVVRKGNKLIGYNSDAIGFELSLKQFVPQLPLLAPAWVLGTGGASKAVSYVLQKLNQPYRIISRTPKTSNQISYQQLADQDWLSQRLIVNTTPVGTFPNVDESPPIPLHLLGQQHFIYDLIYNPTKTLLLREGESRGAQILNGLPMLHQQAESAWQIWQDANLH